MSPLKDLLTQSNQLLPTQTRNAADIPKILEYKDIIVLSEAECICGRTKERAHCPTCGRTKLYAMAQTVICKLPNGDVLKDCKAYRCVQCGTRFTDIDWYFNCSAPKRIDWAATKKLQEEKKEQEKRAKQDEWMIRINSGERFDHNMRTKCKSEAGFDPEEMRMLMLRTKKYPRHRLDKAILETITDREKFDAHVVDCNYCNTHDDYCAEALKIRNGG